MSGPKVIVYHSGYGCDTGCCGHVIDIEGMGSKFSFNHPPYNGDEEAYREFARAIVEAECGAEHVADICWDECEIRYD